MKHPRLAALVALNELRGALCAGAAAWALIHGHAHAQNSPLSGLAQRGTVQASDIIPIMPAGGSQLMQTTVAAIISPATAGSTGTVQGVNLTVPGFTCATTGTTTLTVTCSLGSGASSTTFLRGDGTWAVPSYSGGSVTSVGLSLPAIFTVSGSPVTSSGTLSAALASETANTVFAAPNGSNGAPTFRALSAADIPGVGSSTCNQTGAVNSEGCFGVPLNGQTANYTLVAGDAGGLVNLDCSAACTLTIPANASVAYATGTIIDVANVGAASDTIAIASDTLETGSGGALATGSVSLPVGGTLSLLKIAATTWLASGAAASPECVAVASYTVSGSATSTFTIGGIPGGYSDLRLTWRGRSASVGAHVLVQFNGDATAADYANAYDNGGYSAGNGVNPSSTAGLVFATVDGGGPTNAPDSAVYTVHGYAQTAFTKSGEGAQFLFSSSSFASPIIGVVSGNWDQTPAITSLTVVIDAADTFVAGTKLSVAACY